MALLAGCSRPKLTAARPHALVTPAALDFGQTPVLFPVRRSALLSDASTVPLSVTAVRLEGAQAAAFAVDTSLVINLSPGATQELVVIFTPPATGAFAATLAVDTDDPDRPTVEVPLTGVATTSAALEVRPALLDFGRVGEGQTAVRSLSLKSAGMADLYLASLGFTPGSPDGFALLDGTAPATLAAGATATLAVRYSPPGGAQSGPAALRIVSSDPAHPVLDVPLSSSINRAPIPLARGQVNGGTPHAGELDTAVGATVQLDGSQSADPDGDLPLALTWALVARPQGSAAQLSAQAGPASSLRLDAPGSYSVLLAATDATGVPALAPSRLDLRALPPEQLKVELVWDKVPPDLDLHFLELSPQGIAVGDCSWTDPDPSWFPGGADANPHHGGDKLTGYGPEDVTWKAPHDGDYQLAVAYKADHGAKEPSTTASVRVFAFGQQIAELHHQFVSQGESWTAGVVHWPAATVEVTP